MVLQPELDEKLLDLSYHVVKNAGPLSICFISIKVVERSRDVTLIRESFRVLSLFLKNCTESDNVVFRQALESVGDGIVSASFRSIQSDLVSSFTPSIADILYHFAKSYPSQTRDVIAKLPGADLRQTKAMFWSSGVISLKNFRLQVNEMHQQAMSS
uniref:Uncharacterized protein n=1 Tax=Ditylenchus dipsaci TaxID=166011 RepID=A0A915D4L3_9BILA